VIGKCTYSLRSYVGGEGCQQNYSLTVSGSIGEKGAGSLVDARNVIGRGDTPLAVRIG